MRRVESKGRRPMAASSWLSSLSGDDASCATTGGTADKIRAKIPTRIELHTFIHQALKGAAAGVMSFHPRREATWHAPAVCPILPFSPCAREAILTDNSPSLNSDPAALPASNCSRLPDIAAQP